MSLAAPPAEITARTAGAGAAGGGGLASPLSHEIHTCELHTNRLEDMLMARHKISYKVAREVVLESRETLGMSKYEPWTEELRGACDRLYGIRYANGGGGAGGNTDSDSTETPGTLQSLSCDHDEPEQQQRVGGGGAGGVPSKKSLTVDVTEEPTETELTGEDGEAVVEADTPATYVDPASPSAENVTNKKQRGVKGGGGSKKGRRRTMAKLFVGRLFHPGFGKQSGKQGGNSGGGGSSPSGKSLKSD
jgi:hypothetical protein